MSGKNKTLVGDELWKRSDHISSELFALTYGTLVVQLIKDYEDYDEVNTQLEKMYVPLLSAVHCAHAR
jgi:hypothetical protein